MERNVHRLEPAGSGFNRPLDSGRDCVQTITCHGCHGHGSTGGKCSCFGAHMHRHFSLSGEAYLLFPAAVVSEARLPVWTVLVCSKGLLRHIRRCPGSAFGSCFRSSFRSPFGSDSCCGSSFRSPVGSNSCCGSNFRSSVGSSCCGSIFRSFVGSSCYGSCFFLCAFRSRRCSRCSCILCGILRCLFLGAVFSRAFIGFRHVEQGADFPDIAFFVFCGEKDFGCLLYGRRIQISLFLHPVNLGHGEIKSDPPAYFASL